MAEPDLTDRHHLIAALQRIGCVAADEEADIALEAAAGDAGRLDDYVRRRTAGEPVAWIVGWTSFAGRRLHIEPGVYVPRPQTELVAAAAVEHLPDRGVALELCCGCGAIAAAIEQARPRATIVATDIDERAVHCARMNGVNAVVSRLDRAVPRSLERRVDVLVACAPYVPSAELETLARDVREYEPRISLDGGDDGLDVIRDLAWRAPRWLRARGAIVLEIGAGQDDAVAQLLAAHDLVDATVLRDDDGDVRGIVAHHAPRWPRT